MKRGILDHCSKKLKITKMMRNAFKDIPYFQLLFKLNRPQHISRMMDSVHAEDSGRGKVPQKVAESICNSVFQKSNWWTGRMAQWLRVCTLLFQRTWVWFPTPTSDTPSPVIPAPGNPEPSCVLHGLCTHVHWHAHIQCTSAHIYTHLHIVKMFKSWIKTLTETDREQFSDRMYTFNALFLALTLYSSCLAKTLVLVLDNRSSHYRKARTWLGFLILIFSSILFYLFCI